MIPALTVEELIAFTNEEREKWRRWLGSHPEALRVTVQRQGRFPTVGSLVDHIFLVERRHLQRLQGTTPLASQSGLAADDASGLFEFGAVVRADLMRHVQALDAATATTVRAFTVQTGSYSLTPRKLVLHILIHEIRHWAQIALALRNGGFDPPGDHDLFYSQALK
jgi:uncharacterized damage-inducible protein DinB